MKKYILRLLVVVLSGICNSQSLHTHGFGEGTLIRMTADCWQHITTIANDFYDEPVEVTSYKQCTGQSVRQQVKRGGESDTNCYFTLGFDEYKDDITCTPTQEFYLPHTKQWLAACDLKVGDVLLGSCEDHHMHDQHKVLKHIEFVKKPLHVYSIELENVHTFRVGRHCIVTHNMALPCATLTISGTFEWLGLAKLAACFGPITVSVAICGVVLGAATFYYFSRNKVVHYDLQFDIPHIEQRRWSERDIPSIGCCIYNDSGSISIPVDDQFCGENRLRGIRDGDISWQPKTIPDILQGAVPGRDTKGRSVQWVKPGGYRKALEDFDNLGLAEIKDITTNWGPGKTGVLPDGKKVTVRPGSTEGRPTLEIQTSKKDKIKIRYGNEKSSE